MTCGYYRLSKMSYINKYWLENRPQRKLGILAGFRGILVDGPFWECNSKKAFGNFKLRDCWAAGPWHPCSETVQAFRGCEVFHYLYITSWSQVLQRNTLSQVYRVIGLVFWCYHVLSSGYWFCVKTIAMILFVVCCDIHHRDVGYNQWSTNVFRWIQLL